MGFFTNLLDFERQLTFYASYHHNGVNKFIHTIFVPTIMWSVLVWLSNFTLFDLSPAFLNGPVGQWLPQELQHGSAALAVILFYIGYYILLEPLAGLVYVPVLVTLLHYASVFLNMYGPAANQLALYVHVSSWIMQFAGHGIFERRAPALFDSLVQAFLLAPLFVWMEVLFVLGYRPKLRARLDKKVVEEITKWKASKSSTAPSSSVAAESRPKRKSKKTN